jgi:phage terminase small subunit
MPAQLKNPSRSKNRYGGGEKGVGTARKRGNSTNTPSEAALISEGKPLTEQQRAFAKFWAQGDSPLAASVKAGYADNGSYAYRMIYMPNILKLYNEEKAAFERDSGMTRQRVIEGFLEGIEMAKTLAEPSSVIAGWREVGKMCGYYEPVQVKHTVSHEGKILVDRLESLSDDELFAIIQRQAAAMASPVPLLPSEVLHDDDDTGGPPP